MPFQQFFFSIVFVTSDTATQLYDKVFEETNPFVDIFSDVHKHC
jgi:hypothetical protein